MAELIKYVDTDVVGGAGDGSTWANAFSTASAWEAAGDDAGNLVASSNWMHAYYRGNTQDSTSLIISGWTTGVTNYILIEGSTDSTGRHAGVWNDAKVTLAKTGASLEIYEDYVRIDGFQIQSTETSTYTAGGIYIGSVGTSDIRISNMIIKGVCSGTGIGYGIVINDSTATVNIWNCIIYGFRIASDTDFIGLRIDTALAVNVYSSLIEGNTVGIQITAGTCNVNNSAIFNNADDFSVAGGTINCDYCASDDANSSAYTHGVDFTSEATDWAAIFTDYANGDFRLKNYIGARCIINKGVSITYGNPDISGIARGATWDIGPFEYGEYLPRHGFVNFANGAGVV